MENEHGKKTFHNPEIKLKPGHKTTDEPDLLVYMEDIVSMIMKPPQQSANPLHKHMEVRQTMTVSAWMEVVNREKEKAFEAGRKYERMNGDWITGPVAMAYLECSRTTLKSLRDNELIDFSGRRKGMRYYRPSLLHYKSEGKQGRRIHDEAEKEDKIYSSTL